ncbi:hypothetical protein CFP56_009019 [Quercus suber]|uniref:Uncharacterized protein n=1 Tax=Quercus suber TaxID=58331 RepID=A0AAW0L353_QUESU
MKRQMIETEERERRERQRIERAERAKMRDQAWLIDVTRSTFKIMTKALCIIRRVGYTIEILNCMINDGFFLIQRFVL